MPAEGYFLRWPPRVCAGEQAGWVTWTAAPQGRPGLRLPAVTHSEKAGSGQGRLRSCDEWSAEQEVRWLPLAAPHQGFSVSSSNGNHRTPTCETNTPELSAVLK